MRIDPLASARVALECGDVLIAYDEAARVVHSDPDNLEARYIATLALARSGASDRAARDTEMLLAMMARSSTSPLRLREDVAALDARVAKQQALAASVPARAARAREAARRYERINDTHASYYACINAATLSLLAGDRARARHLAVQARDLARGAAADPMVQEPDTAYWAAVTDAEASLLLDDVGAARSALRRAAALPYGDRGARATTRNQLRIVCAELGVDPALLDELAVSGIVHYCGHVAGPSVESHRFRPEYEDDVRKRVVEYLADKDVGFAFGSLASGADIVIAEALLARGGELDVVLPFGAEEFERVSVRPGGAHWVPRFRACLDRAASVILACDSAYMGDDALFAYASRIAMGHARNRAAVLAVAPEQLAVWDGLPARGAGGTADDIAAWRSAGGTVHVVDVPAAPAGSASAARAAPNTRPRRTVQAILFADVRGFGRLRDEHYPTVMELVYGPLAAVVERYDDAVRWLNSWGDALQVVFEDVVSAGSCALELQEVNRAIDRNASALPVDLDLRIGLHVGPVLELRDPFRRSLGWWGREITRAARIEPRTPEGEVYATDAFAALLALEASSGLGTEYVGRVTTAKDFETIPMYRVRRA